MISILLATMGRPEQAQAVVRGAWETTEGHDVEIVAAVDGPAQDAAALAELGCVVNHSEDPRGSSRAWNDALALAKGDPVVLGADDLEWQPGWLDAALEMHAEFPDSMIGFNDGHWDGNHEIATHYLMPRAFIVEVLGGVVAWDFYRHSFIDAEACERARRAGRYRWCEEARVYHRHWLFGDRSQDATDTRNLGGHAESERIYKERAVAGFPNDGIEPVIHAY